MKRIVRLTESDLSRIVRRVINEQVLDADRITKEKTIKDLEALITKDGMLRAIDSISDNTGGDYEEWRGVMELLKQKFEALSLPENMPILKPKEIESDLDMDIEY